MAYSSWVSDLKTRSSVGFLGKVVNLLVQAKDRIDENHTNIATTSSVVYSSEMITSAGAISTTIPFTAVSTGSGGFTCTLADGTTLGQWKAIMLVVDGGDLLINTGTSDAFLVTGLAKDIATFDTAGERIDLFWTSTPGGNKWVVAANNGVVFSDE